MTTEGNIAIAGALIRALGRIPEAQKEEERYLFDKGQREENAAFQGQLRDRQRKDWSDADEAANAAMQEHLSDVMEARKYTPPGEFMDSQTRLVDTDGDGIPDSVEGSTGGTGGAPALSSLALAVSPGTSGGKGVKTIPTTAALERVGTKAPAMGGPGMGIPGPGRNDPGKTLLGTYGMSAGYQATRKRIVDLYSSLHGRAEEIAKEYESAVAKATTDDQRRAALLRLSKRWSGIKPKFDDLTNQVGQFQHDMMVAKFAKQQHGLMMEMQGIPVDKAARGPWLDRLYEKYGDVLNEHQVSRELLEGANITPITYPVGDKVEQDGVLVDLGNGSTFVPQALAGWASGMMSADKVYDTTAQARQKAIQMRAYDADRKSQTEIQKAQLRLQAASLGGGRRKLTQFEEFEQASHRLAAAKEGLHELPGVFDDWKTINWDAVAKLNLPKEKLEAVKEMARTYEFLSQNIGKMATSIAAQKADTQAKHFAQRDERDRAMFKLRVAEAISRTKFQKVGNLPLPGSKQDKELQETIRNIAAELGENESNTGAAIAEMRTEGAPKSVMQNGVLHLSSGLPK